MIKMGQPKAPLEIQVWHVIHLFPDSLIGTLTVVPEDLARRTPHDGWWLLEGADTGEMWLRSTYSDQSAKEIELPKEEVYDAYGFVVSPLVLRRWDRTNSYWMCRQDRARAAWDEFAESQDPAREVPREQWENLLMNLGPPLELRSTVLFSFMSPYSVDDSWVMLRQDSQQLDSQQYYELLVEQSEELELRESRTCLLYTSPSPRDRTRSRMPSSA
eukprot:TRINITY_DN14300_c0_g1_i3.p1 TRINITY_DN14300_c0_g1~~TRINITY_DN14300_c0_g1_i3.p1  ORF type:complete len:216 (-),score=53.70 TRINITY_DN14300_c0_g1_i3:40-687(-)